LGLFFIPSEERRVDLQQHLIELSQAAGVSGYEAPVRELIEQTWQPLADDLRIDAMGSLIATIAGTDPEPRPRVLITAHMDEIGLMVTRIEDGFIRFTSVGGIDKRVLPGQPVMVHGEKSLPGLIGTRAPHVIPQSQRKNYPDLEQLVIDVGLPAKQVEKLVRVGDVVTFDIEPVELGDGWISGKAMDNRASVACMTRLLRHFGDRRPRWDVIIAATVQEETGLKGSEPLAWHIEPDLAIVVDTTWGIGAGVGDDKGFKLGDGPTLIIGPDANPKLFSMIRDVAKEIEAKITPEVAPGASGTEAHAVHMSRSGVPTAVISIPIRNMHTPVETVAVKDIERAARLIAAFVWTLDGETMDHVWLDED
jgi:tetrahedral aminopeptidase